MLSTAGCSLKKVEVQRVSITPAPEEAKGILYVGSEQPVKVKSLGVQLIATKDILGVIPQDTTLVYHDKVKNADVMTNAKGFLLVKAQALDLKGYSEVIADKTTVPVGIEGTDVITAKNVEGYYLVHKDDLKVLMQKAKEHDAWVAKASSPAPK